MFKNKISRYKRVDEIDKLLMKNINDYYNKIEGLYLPYIGTRIYTLSIIQYKDITIFISLSPTKDVKATTLKNENFMTLVISEDFMRTHSKLERLQLMDFYIMDFFNKCINVYSLFEALTMGVKASSMTLFPPFTTPLFKEFLNSIIDENKKLEDEEQKNKHEEGDGINGK